MNIKAYIIERECADCGEPFEIKIDWETNKIITKCFNGGKIRLGIGMWAKDKMGKNPDGSIKWIRIHPWWKELKYRLTDLKRLIFHQYKDVEYWECGKCLHKDKMVLLQQINIGNATIDVWKAEDGTLIIGGFGWVEYYDYLKEE